MNQLGNQIPDKKSHRLEDLSQKLYSPNSPDIVNKKVKPLFSSNKNIPHDWQEEPVVQEEIFDEPKKKGKGPLVFFIITFLFAIASFGFAWYYIVNQGDLAKNVSVNVTGPVSVPAGSEYPLELSVTNTNSFPIELVDLVVEYPSGTKRSDVPDEDIGTYREGLGTIGPGQTVTRTISAVLFGESQQKQIINARAEYRIANSNAIIHKDKQIDVLIESGPIEFVLDTLNESTSGQETELTLHIRSNTDAPITDMLVSADFPDVFSFISAIPNATYSNNHWLIKVLDPRQSQTIKIKGIFNGETGIDRFIRFTAGAPDKLDNQKITNIFASSLEKVSIVKPFLSADFDFKEGDIVNAGNVAKGNVVWQNNSGGTLTNIGIELSLSGSALNKKILNTEKGFYRSSDNKIIWNETTNSDFGKVDDGGSGVVSFEFGTFNFNEYPILTKNPEINLDLSVSARRPTQNGVPEVIRSSITKKIKIATELGFNARSLYSIGPFVNSGSLPPMPEKKTTYTIVWALTDSSNDVANAKVTAYLPLYMDWNNKFSPTSDNLIFDETTRKITWSPGTIPAGTGYTKPSREVSFQVTLFPSTNQVHEVPNLITNITYSGTDTFTKNEISIQSDKEITTRLTNDPNFTSGMEKVGGE